jgi:hypothetical protein
MSVNENIGGAVFLKDLMSIPKANFIERLLEP